MRPSRYGRAAALPLAIAALALAGCSAPADEGASATSTSGAAGASTGQASDCAPASLQTLTPGKLTVGTDSPAYEPWFVDNDPSNGKGYESAVAYAVAEQLGYAQSDVVWETVTFTQAIAPGPKSFDVDINQISITAERANDVDFSTGYYDVTQAVVTVEGSKVADATTIAELKDATIGAMVGSTSLQAITEVIAPSTEPLVFNDNDAAKQALQAGTVDAIVVDLPTAYYMTAAELDGGILVGQLPGTASQTEQFGFVLDKGSSLTACVSQAVDAVRANGQLDTIAGEWLAGAGAPVLS